LRSPIEKLRERCERNLAVAEAKASSHLREIMSGTHAESRAPVTEMSVMTKAAIALAGWNQARARSNIAAKAGPKMFGVVVMPAQIADRAAWEAKAKALEAKVIDTTAGPAAIEPVKEDK